MFFNHTHLKQEAPMCVFTKNSNQNFSQKRVMISEEIPTECWTGPQGDEDLTAPPNKEGDDLNPYSSRDDKNDKYTVDV